jgi:hypothetical protein
MCTCVYVMSVIYMYFVYVMSLYICTCIYVMSGSLFKVI